MVVLQCVESWAIELVELVEETSGRSVHCWHREELQIPRLYFCLVYGCISALSSIPL